ncbi:MAG: hypothetical protein KKF67_02220 [Nanoarchaeota archaeon]|nr:hypothetical protein [Nanoarchaeota archaeon]
MKEKEEGKTHLSLNYFLIIISVFILISLILFIYYPKDKTCGDRTLYNECSLNQPYFCENGVLIEKASACSCPENFTVKEDSCFSEYMVNPKTITLSYLIGNEIKEINFTVYERFYEYSKNISRFIQYSENEKPTKRDFKLKSIDSLLQKDFLIPLVVKIQNLDGDGDTQVKIATSIVQNISYNEVSNLTSIESALNYKYPYEVLYDMVGICSEKSDLLVLLLKELGYGVAILYYPSENHEAVGIKCPVKKSIEESGYCFIETTSSDNVKPFSIPEIIEIYDGKTADVF